MWQCLDILKEKGLNFDPTYGDQMASLNVNVNGLSKCIVWKYDIFGLVEYIRNLSIL